MIKNKITNISNIKLEFFVKVENSDDVLVSINPSEITFSDGEEMTKSMRVFERKNLISIIKSDFDSVSINEEGKTLTAIWDSSLTQDLKDFHGADAHIDIEQALQNELKQNITTSITDSENPYDELLAIDLFFEGESGVLDEAKKQAEEYVEEGEPVKEKKKYNYKKKPGRKKKRGPKPGSKRKKEE